VRVRSVVSVAVLPWPSRPVTLLMLVGVCVLRDSFYTHAFRIRLKKNLPDSRVATAERAPQLCAALLAAEMDELTKVRAKPAENKIDNLAVALTEQRNSRSEHLEKMSARDCLELFGEEER